MSEVTGKIIVIEEPQTFSSGFTKQVIVVETDEKFPQTVPIDFVKEKIEDLKKFSVGDSVTVAVNIRGNEYKGRYFVNLQGWKIEAEKVTGGKPASSSPKPSGGGGRTNGNSTNNDFGGFGDIEEDAPF